MSKKTNKKKEVLIKEKMEEVKIAIDVTPKLVTPDKLEGYKKTPIYYKELQHTKDSYQALLDSYKEQNPVKYEQKKSELAEKLRRLK